MARRGATVPVAACTGASASVVIVHFTCGRACACMNMEWTNELIFEFLTLYENEPALWNSSSPQHKNKNDVHDAWLRIKSNLADGTIPITELKKKKENLMSTYRKVKAKIKESMKTGSGTDSIYKPEWPFYDIMAKFLDNVYKPRKTKTTIMVSNFYLYLIIIVKAFYFIKALLFVLIII